MTIATSQSSLALSDFVICNIVLLGTINDSTRISMVVIGLLAFAGGLLQMVQLASQIDHVNRNLRDKRMQRFEQRKFRRRSWASTMIASIGILMVTLYWARDPYVFASLISVVLILLLAVMFLAVVDLLSVGLQAVTDTNPPAREALVKEYLRQRAQLIEQTEKVE